MSVKGSQGILLAYAVGQALGCSLLYVPLNDDGSFPPPRNLPAVETTNCVKFLGLEQSGVVALACLNGALILEDITTHTRRSITMNEPSVWLWIDSITILHEMVMVTRHKNRGIVIDLYSVPPLANSDSTPGQSYASSPHAPHSRVEIKQAQIATISPPLLPPSQNSNPNSPQDSRLYKFHVLAALPSSIDHYLLTVARPSPDLPPELQILLLGDDQGSRRKNVLRNTLESNTTIAEEENDDYDSDSTLNRIAQPSQVLDLQIGSSGKRAMAIHITAHTNDRTIWAYALDDKEGPLIARKLSFSDEQLQQMDLEVDGPGEASFSAAGEELRSVLKTHACRVTLDELSGKVVVGADCEELMVFQY
ncbi:hypothetical protein FRB94_008808 [Tulasnella sp. JGI-2019a]|nr:hypothetical protein FRB94_008808 [Tulasnella sp. JGI-2019a]